MKISIEEVEHVARLARLKFGEDEIKTFTGQINEILVYMDKLNELNTSDVPPTFHAMEKENAFRNDEVKPSLELEKVLSNAPEDDGESFVVPKIF
ncbi:MAG: Asp-tRNA(Asn)/Glu-tRNA(Gln) amidotransferase subunit GatB [Deltaproteobacteria bacterium]|nr:MAG: Asp-tRNA(Asn)/Glu-tRNA(Gln) amidotransferase subunit GatB [Deltaproteobacteria bacterium]